MLIKFATINAPLFTEGGLSLSPNWTAVDLDAIEPEGRDILEKYLGSIVQVHPDDEEVFVRATGLELREGRLVGDDIGSRHSKVNNAPVNNAPIAPNMRAPRSASANPPASVPTQIDRTNEGGPAPVQPQPETAVPEISSSAEPKAPKRGR